LSNRSMQMSKLAAMTQRPTSVVTLVSGLVHARLHLEGNV
jgi:hypothetical protein